MWGEMLLQTVHPEKLVKFYLTIAKSVIKSEEVVKYKQIYSCA